MANDRVSKTILQYAVDQSSVNKAIASADKVEGRIKSLASQADKVTGKTTTSLNKLETVTQQISRALSGLGLGGAGQALGGVSDILQLKNATANAAEGSKLLSTGLIGLTAVSAATAAAIQIMNQNLEPTARLLTVATNQLEAYYTAIATGTTDTLKKQLDNAKQLKQALDSQIAKISKSQEDAFVSEQHAFGGDLRARILFALASTNPELQKLGARLQALKDQSDALDGTIQGLTSAMSSTAVAANDAKAAIEKETAASIDYLDKETRRRVQLAQTDRTATTEQVKSRLDAIKDEKAALQDELANLLKKDQTNKQVLEAEGKALAALQDLNEEERHLTTTTLALAKARAAEKDKLEGEQRVADATKKYSADVKAIEQRDLEERARIQDQLNKRIVDITRQAADAAAQALDKLNQQRQDLTTGLGRDLSKIDRDQQFKVLDIRIQAQREEVKALRDHEREKRRILEDAQDKEFELIQNRDFLGLFNLRRQTTKDLNRSDEDFGGQSQARREGQTQQLDDLRQQIERERQERRIAYQQALQDAQLSYRRELTQAAQQKQAQLLLARQAAIAETNDLRNRTTLALTLRRQQGIEEIRIAGLVSQARIDYLNRERQLLLQQAQGLVGANPIRSSSSGGRTLGIRGIAPQRDSGGFLRAGQMARIGVGGEAFNGAPFPGVGMFMPFVPGNVTKTNHFSPQFNISGSDPNAIKRAVYPIVKQAFMEVVGQ